MSLDKSSDNGFLNDIDSLLDMSIYNLPNWIGKHKQQKIVQLSNDVYSIYNVSDGLQKIDPFIKVMKILLRNLETKIYSPNAVYYMIKTLHFLHIYIKYLPRLSIQLILCGNRSFFSKLVLQINLFLSQFTYDSKVNSLLFLDLVNNNSKYYPYSDSCIIACILYEYLKLCNLIIKELIYCKLVNDELSQLDSKIYTKFINSFSKISPLKLLITSYNIMEFQYDKENPKVDIEYKNEMYNKFVIKTASMTLFPPPPVYELRIMLLEFLNSSIKLVGLDSTLNNKYIWILKTPLCRVNNGQIKIYNKDLIKTKISFNCKSNISQLIMLSILLIDADALTINCNSMRYFYGQYYLSLPTAINEQDGTTSTLSMGSRITIDPKLASFIVYKMQSISLDILSQLDQMAVHSISNTLYDKLVNLAWYYGTSFPDKYIFPESDIGFNTCCGGSDNGLMCRDISTYDIILSMRLISQSIDEVVLNNPHATKSNIIHMDLIMTKTDNEFATLQDRVEYSVDRDYWIINNNICTAYISPTIKIKTGSEIIYTDPKSTPCKCNIFCLYNKHIYNNISWICSRGISMSCKYRKKIIIKTLEIMLQCKENSGKNTPVFNGFNIAKLISNRSKYLLKSLISIYSELNIDINSSLDDQTLHIYSQALDQIL